MKFYYLRYFSSVFVIGLYTIAPILLCYRFYHNVQTSFDIFVACLLMIVGSLSCVLDELTQLLKMMCEQDSFRQHLKRQNTTSEATVICPECKGQKVVSWEEGEEPQECWKCSGYGKI